LLGAALCWSAHAQSPGAVSDTESGGGAAALSQAALLEPADGAVIGDNLAQLKWAPGEGALAYKIELASACRTNVFYSGVSNLPIDVALDNGDDAWTVTATEVQNSIVSSGCAVLSWDAVANATSYEVDVTMPDGSVREFPAATTNLTLPLWLPQGQYAWQVIARASQGPIAMPVAMLTVDGDAPVVTNIAVSSNTATLRVAAAPGWAHRLEASVDLTNWQTVARSASLSGGQDGGIHLADTNRSLYPNRFYRVAKDAELKARLVIFSDSHLMDSSLLINDGPAFQCWASTERKLLQQSPAIMDEMVRQTLKAHPDIVLVCGDLTKDGELVGHQAMANRFNQLRAAGIKVYVCPGNHDINNPFAYAFDGYFMNSVPTVTPSDFASVYGDCGYKDAIARDPSSLSYVAEPVDGLWILSMDSVHYELGYPYSGGYFDDSRLSWITNQLALAQSQGKTVLGMMHHAILEHCENQKNMNPDRVLDNFEQVSEVFASYGMRVVFTGHTHEQDIAKADCLVPVSGTIQVKPLFDIGTGSIATFPCPFRIADLTTKGALIVRSSHISSINYDLGGVDLQTFASNQLRSRVQGSAFSILMSRPFNLSYQEAEWLAPTMTEVLLMRNQGDESLSKMSTSSQDIMRLLHGSGDDSLNSVYSNLNAMSNDAAPADNNLVIDMTTGRTVP
jgi:predicted phosphodiesterase